MTTTTTTTPTTTPTTDRIAEHVALPPDALVAVARARRIRPVIAGSLELERVCLELGTDRAHLVATDGHIAAWETWPLEYARELADDHDPTDRLYIPAVVATEHIRSTLRRASVIRRGAGPHAQWFLILDEQEHRLLTEWGDGAGYPDVWPLLRDATDTVRPAPVGHQLDPRLVSRVDSILTPRPRGHRRDPHEVPRITHGVARGASPGPAVYAVEPEDGRIRTVLAMPLFRASGNSKPAPHPARGLAPAGR